MRHRARTRVLGALRLIEARSDCVRGHRPEQCPAGPHLSLFSSSEDAVATSPRRTADSSALRASWVVCGRAPLGVPTAISRC